jgi:hypothetical protein
MTLEFAAPSPVEARARRAYEWSLARDGLARAAVVLVLAALAARVAGVALQPATLAIVLLAWTFLGWRRGWWLRGARIGLLGGLAALLLPMSLLRPCCPPGMMTCAACCAAPGACALVGVGVGALLSALLPRGGDGGQRARAGVGMLLGVVSVGSVRCSGLFVGEALGMLAGLVVGTLALGAGQWALARARAA